MKTRAVRLYGKKDLRMEEFELPEIKEDEILVKVVSDSICMSTYKAAILGSDHKRVPSDIAVNPVIVGHEMAGDIVQVGSKWKNDFKPGNKFSMQPALNYKGSMDSPGYSYRYCGGDATYVIMPQEVMELGCLLNYDGKAYYEASLAEPMSCIIGGFHASFHTVMGSYEHKMGIVEGGKLAMLAAAGPMGLGAIDYAMHCDRRPALIVVTDIEQGRLDRARAIFTKEDAKKVGIELIFVNTKDIEDVPAYLRNLTGGTGFDDVFVYSPVKPVVEQGDKILGRDGCLNFFAGPTDTKFSAMFNFYNVHYQSTHTIGTTGGNTNDMIESLRMTEKNIINPAVMVTHVGGLDSAADATIRLTEVPAGKKLIYTNIFMDITAIDEFEEKGKKDPRFKKLSEIAKNNKGLWSLEAEKYLLENWKTK
ncbi:zinc-binding dehydrogenase [Clostridium estertheticum]|uniref:L-sorbose 1-phosphate reductase n=1 Tax=Clostridium estertheticum subsp. estertheticum TaxID=1552 RepID=A0A1J0GDY3_9CLOT|nr:zinc-binding dehydrogenase [Clostridium estertheticum]APC39519.1 L-sorbose 1-phosphate reductase [Clostridium estertheticum subsp. estertheticum]MBU3072199.1 zinc-binding dehydrogenase [Clostridium estertheticum]MBU3162291.1 zinc-binding dehydrogenase [Clostridium estertheticum]MBU3184647.1 zinc-binding dehydrogenase [Clostridium estertheticum]MBZ9614453.1 zinc-binding dehydrogenase [Clostridium estertheticum subsp. laramiense]